MVTPKVKGNGCPRSDRIFWQKTVPLILRLSSICSFAEVKQRARESSHDSISWVSTPKNAAEFRASFSWWIPSAVLLLRDQSGWERAIAIFFQLICKTGFACTSPRGSAFLRTGYYSRTDGE
jgi:hypothetical protein